MLEDANEFEVKKNLELCHESVEFTDVVLKFSL